MHLFLQRWPNLPSPHPFSPLYSLCLPPPSPLQISFSILRVQLSLGFSYLYNNYIGEKLHLCDLLDLRFLNTGDLGLASQGCQAKGYCEFLTFPLWPSGATLQIHLLYIPGKRPRQGSGLPGENIAHLRAGNLRVWNIPLLSVNKKTFKDSDDKLSYVQ